MRAKASRSASLPLNGLARKVSVVFPLPSASVRVFRTSSGQLSPSWGKGGFVMPPSASENALINTSRSGAAISR